MNIQQQQAFDAMREALEDTTFFLERHSNRWDGVNGKHPHTVVEAARAALTAAKEVTAQGVAPVSMQWLAEMIMSDCGCSTNNQRLLDRIIDRIDQYERANTAQQPAPAQRLSDERSAAEQEYSITAHNYPESPIGSRDWTLYWAGWLARSTHEFSEKNGITLEQKHD